MSLLQEINYNLIDEEEHESGFYICNKCEGTGKEPDSIFDCQKCWGYGYLDWIEKITGKECPYTYSSSGSSSSISMSSYSVPTSVSVKNYNPKKRRKDEHDNFIRNRTLQRLHKVFDKLKRCLQRCRYSKSSIGKRGRSCEPNGVAACGNQ